jgi:hypothetical protein
MRHKACTKGALSGTRRCRHNDRAPISFDNSGMDNQVLVRVPCYTPVHSPFKQGECLVHWQGHEWAATIKEEQDLGTDPAPQVPRRRETHVKVYKRGVVFCRVLTIQDPNVFCDSGNRGLQPRCERADPEDKPFLPQPAG